MSSKQKGSGNGFQGLGLSDDVYKGIVRMGFRNPTPVQRKSLPIILTGADTVVMARTGSGKTAAFLIPILEKLNTEFNSNSGGNNNIEGCKAVILSPTRELSMQTLKVLHKISHFVVVNESQKIRSIGIHGGEGMEAQFNALASKPHIIVATPGRLAHHLSEIPDFTLGGCTTCVLDEADRLIEMGFAHQIREIASTLPEHCQKVMLSATMPKMLVEFTKSGFATDPQVVRLDNEASVSAELRVAFVTVKSHDKDAAMLHVLHHIHQDLEEHTETRTGLVLVFCATRHHVEYVATLLNNQKEGTATMIYGTLDQEARKHNLAKFRSGRTPVLVVTDVAARGIDVPLIDHVVHYSFPPSAKLFVHRSGRAARAGRIGYCWSLVEPDEMPYMVDLHLFLARKLSTGQQQLTADTNDDKDKKNRDDNNSETVYTLDEMTPDMVHYGSVPESVLVHEIENLRRLLESEFTGSHEAETLRALTRVCNNAMKQYRRTRPEASREGVRRAKAILEGEKLETGQRLNSGGAMIPPHPLLLGMERRRYQQDKAGGRVTSGLNDLDTIKKREEFLMQMSNFRPKETIFEAFATGGGKDIGVASHIDRGRTSGAKGKQDNSAALSAMKNMRRQMKLARNKGVAMVIAGSSNARDMNGDEDSSADTDEEEVVTRDEIKMKKSRPAGKVSAPPAAEGKRRMSKAERKRLKKKQGSSSSSTSAVQGGDQSTTTTKAKNKRGGDFRDEAFFIDHNYSERDRLVEAAMQPSSSSNQKGSTAAAFRLEEAMMDVVGDENADLVQKQRMMRWDNSKRKYVQTTVGSELSGDSKSKKLRLESGQLVKSDKMKLGEVYEKWQKKTNRSIGRTGVFDDDDVVQFDDDNDAATTGKRRNGAKQKGGNNNNKGKKDKGDEVKSAIQIRKEREQKQDMKLKNMKKADRRRITGSGNKKGQNDDQDAIKGFQGKKKGPSGRWASNAGGKRRK